jgi:hypothetical protein
VRFPFFPITSYSPSFNTGCFFSWFSFFTSSTFIRWPSLSFFPSLTFIGWPSLSFYTSSTFIGWPSLSFFISPTFIGWPSLSSSFYLGCFLSAFFLSFYCWTLFLRKVDLYVLLEVEDTFSPKDAFAFSNFSYWLISSVNWVVRKWGRVSSSKPLGSR